LQPLLKCAVEVVGIDRMLVSVDYPFSANARGRTFLQAAARWLNEAEMKKLTGRDAASVLQLSLVDGTRFTRHGAPA
jgi:predicted TIM-barrel fold metal-dependent hydrolase